MTTTTTLLPRLAKRIIQALGSSGQPPEEGLQYFSVGLDPYLSVIDEEYLSDYVQDGGGIFKMVVGIYGGGKTHFLYSLRDCAWERGFAVSYVSLKSSGESPFYALDLVYKAIMSGLVAPMPDAEREQGDARGIGAFLRFWYGQQIQTYLEQGMSQDRARQRILDDIYQIEVPTSLSFRNAIRGALEAYHNNRQDTFDLLCQWLQGEGFDRKALRPHNIQQKIDKTTAFPMIRAVGRAIRELGYSGLVILLDEAERIPSLSVRNREQHLSNLREVIDECGQSSFEGMMIVYAVPDENFLQGKTQIYEALVQRLSTVFTTINPTGVKILLEGAIEDHSGFLCQIGEKLAGIYAVAYNTTLDPLELDEMIQDIATWAEDQRFSDEGYKRLFVQTMVKGLHFLHRMNRRPTIDELSS